MTRKDYERIARAIHSAMIADKDNPERLSGIARAAMLIGGEMYAENARFDSERFYKACGLRSADSVR
jgi:hypothetical protein